MVKVCQQKGVNEVYVSEIIYRPYKEKQVDEVNVFLKARSVIDNFNHIHNGNIHRRHLRKDNLHLNDEGTNLLANNFINALNGTR